MLLEQLFVWIGLVFTIVFFVFILSASAIAFWLFRLKTVEQKLWVKVPDPGADHFLIMTEYEKIKCAPKRAADEAWNGSEWTSVCKCEFCAFAPNTIYRRPKPV